MVKKERCISLDLLRLVSAFAVVMIHVSAIYLNMVSAESIQGTPFDSFAVCVWNAVPKFAVPCFLMTGGMFVLGDEKNSEFRRFYRKAFRNIVVPTAIFSIFFVLYNILRNIDQVRSLQDLPGVVLRPFGEWLLGKPMYHMWYLYLLIVIYLLVPFLIRAFWGIDRSVVRKSIWIYFFFSVLSAWMVDDFVAEWNIGKVFCYLGFFLAGYAVELERREHALPSAGWILLGLGLEALMGIAEYILRMSGRTWCGTGPDIVSPLNPVIAAGGY